MIQISLEGQQELFDVFKHFDERIQTQRVGRLANQVFDDVQAGADAHTQTGALADSVQMRSIKDGYEIFHDLQRAPHALFVHWGTRPHVIKPKHKKSLRWVSGNQFIFAQFVNHPGYKGDPYMVRAATDAKDHFEKLKRQLEIV